MKLFGGRRRKQKALSQVPQRGGGWFSVFESYPGAWQQNVEVKTDTVLTFSAVYACKTLIENDIAKLRMRLVQKTDAGIWEEVENPAFSPVLRKPNHYQTRIEFFQSWMNSKLTWGNAYVLKERDRRGIVVSLYVLNPTRVTVLVSDEGEVFYRLTPDELAGIAGEAITVPAREIIHDKMNTIWHPLVGVSPITANGLAATQALAMQNNNTKFFENGAQPSGIVTTPGAIRQDQADQIKSTWETKFTGANAGRVAVLSDGMTYTPMTPMSAVDAQVIEQLKWSAETVCSTFHVPPYMVGAAQAPAYNNIQALNQQYYSQCLQIHIEAIEQSIDEALHLGPGFGNTFGVEFDLDDLLKMDTATLVKTYAEATQRGMAPNEFRRKLGLPPTEGGDVPFLQEQMWPIQQLANRPMQEQPDDPRPSLPAPDEAVDETDRAIGLIWSKMMKGGPCLTLNG